MKQCPAISLKLLFGFIALIALVVLLPLKERISNHIYSDQSEVDDSNPSNQELIACPDNSNCNYPPTNNEIGKHVPMDMLSRDPAVAKRFKALSGPNRTQDDPELIQFIKDQVIEDRRPYVPKMSHRLYQTPQAKVIDEIFKKKVTI